VLTRHPLGPRAIVIKSDPARRMWTDDFNNLFKTMKRRRDE
jgi:hypothetical protein